MQKNRTRRGAAAKKRRRRAASVVAIRPFERWILPWINEEPYRRDRDDLLPPPMLQRHIDRFIGSFNGSAAAGFLQADIADGKQFGDVEQFDSEEEELSVLRHVIEDRLLRLLPRERGYVAEPLEGVEGIPLHLSFEVIVDRQRIIRVRGRRFDLVVYLVLQLIAKTGITLDRCPAPAPPPYSKEHKCGRLFIAQTGERGKPRKFCAESRSTDSCRERLRKQKRDKQKGRS